MFEACLDPLASICRPPLDHHQIIGYFNALADLPPEAINFAANEIAGSRQYSTWPMPGEIRAKAVIAMAPQLTAGEAWNLAHRAAKRMIDESLSVKVHDGEHIGTSEWNRRILESLPPAVSATLRFMGGRKLVDSTTAYAQFRDEYERQVSLVRRPLMLPAPAKSLLASVKQKVFKALPEDPIRTIAE